MPVLAALPPGYEAWSLDTGGVVARSDVAAAVRAALAGHGTLYAWAGAQADRVTFAGRGEAFGVRLGQVPAVVRHARRGGYVIAPLLGDRFLGTPRFFRELRWSARLSDAGIPTPRLLAGAWHRRGAVHRADVATERLDGTNLASLFFAGTPPLGERRRAVLAAVGRLVRRLHDAGVVHPDLQLGNVLAAPGADSPVAALLDVDTCRAARGPADIARNIQRFYRSWEKWNRRRGVGLSAEDRAVFASAYAEAAR